MKKIISIIALGVALMAGFGCQQLTDLETKVDQNTSDIATLKTQVAALQDIVNKGYVITETKEIAGGYEFTLSNGKKITVTNGKDGKDGKDGVDGKDGDSFFGSVVVDQEAGIVKIVLKDGTAFNIPLAVEKSIVEQINKVMYFPEYSDLKLTFNYFDEKDYEMINLKFSVLPISALELLSKNMDSVFIMVGAFGLKTRASASVGLESTVTYDDAEQTFTAVVDPKNYLDEFGLDTEFGLTVAIADKDFKCQVFSDIIPVHNNCSALVYEGERYHTITLADGRTWMADNLRYVPAGMTPSLDPTNAGGLWYPAKLDWDGSKAVVTPTDDEETIKNQGLLYSPAVALNSAVLPTGEFEDLADSRGICPEGWHIPMASEWIALVGACANKDYKDTTAPYYDSTIDGANINKLNEDGFNLWPYPYVSMGKSYLGNILNKDTDRPCSYMASMMYFASSTSHNATQTYGAMITNNAKKTSVNVAYCTNTNGVAVRCIKD